MAIGLTLLVSNDPTTIQQVSRSLRELSMSPDVCMEVSDAICLLNRRKFDAVVVDLQIGRQSKAVLEAVQQSASNRTAVTFSISSSDAETATAFQTGSRFVFRRPLSSASIRNTLKPAYGLILRERRRYFRCPIAVPVTIRGQSLPEVRCQSVNISEGGMAVSTFVPLRPGEVVHVQFALPGQARPFSTDATICWWRTGHIGVRFVSLAPQQMSELQEWLSQRLEEMLPHFVAEKFS